MPRISRRQGEPVRTAVVREPRAQVKDVGAGIRAQFGTAAAVAKGVTSLVSEISKTNQRVNTTEAEEGVVKFERAKNELFFDPDNGYFNTQGKSAYDTSQDANESLQKLARQYADGMSNPQSRQMFMNVANRHITSGQSDIMRHASQGLQAWEVTTIKAQTENTIENAALYRLKTNPTKEDINRLSIQRELGRQSIHDSAELEGVTGIALNERLQTYDSAFASATINASILDNAESGKTALDKYGGMLEGAERAKFEEKIRIKQESEKTQLDSQQSVATATAIVTANDGNRSAVLSDISKIEDPEMQSKIRREAMYQVNQLETAKAEIRNDIYDDAAGFIADSGSAEAYKAAYPDRWDKLSTKQQKQLEAGEPIVNDWNVWHSIMSKSPEDLRKMKPSEVEKAALKLDNSHRDKLYTEWRRARDGKVKSSDKTDSQVGRTRSAQTKSSVDQLMGKKRSKWTTNDLARADKFYALVDSETRAREEEVGRKLSSEEFTNMLDNITRKVTIERRLWFDAEVGVADIPEEHLGELTNALRRRNIPLTADNLVRAYEQAR